MAAPDARARSQRGLFRTCSHRTRRLVELGSEAGQTRFDLDGHSHGGDAPPVESAANRTVRLCLRSRLRESRKRATVDACAVIASTFQ